MEKNLNNNQQQKMEEPKKQESKKEKANLNSKKKKTKVAVITLSTVIVLFLGLQVYASVNGYGNVFFMIKNLITTGNPAGNQEIFSDKDITLSYKSIELAEGLKIQANRLEIKDGKTKLYLSVKSQNGELIPLKYEVTTISNEGNEITTTTKITGTKPENTENFEYEDILTLDYEVKENQTIVLMIKDTNEKELRTLEINLQTREITVKGEKEFEKISQIELRKYLDIFSLLNDKSGYTESDNLIEIASKIQFMTGNGKAITTERETINEIVKQFYGENAKFETTKNTQGKDVEILKDMKVGVYEKQSDSYDLMEHDRLGRCLKIEDTKVENDIYTVKYIYLLATSDDEKNDKLEELPQYETTIKLKRLEDNVYSKYQIVSIEKGTEVTNKVSTNVEENEKEQDVTNYITSMNWKKYEAVDDGLAFEYPADYTLVKSPDRGIVVEMTGAAVGKDVNTGKAIESKLKIRMYTTTNISSDEVKYNDKNGTGYTTKNGDKWYTNYIDGHNTPGTAGYQKIENYVNYENIGNGRYLQRMIEFEADNRNNLKITNIINKIMGTIQLKHANNTSTNTNTSTASERNEYINTTNWVQVWPEWIGMKFKLPVGFTQEQVVRPDQNNVYVDLKGNVTLAQWSENDAERFPITIRFWNENESNLKQEDVLIYDIDRNVKSTDNKGWTDWMPLNEKYGPTTSPENGYIRRGYARMRDGQIERVIFEMKTTGINVDHYKFMNNVLSSISSTSV